MLKNEISLFEEAVIDLIMYKINQFDFANLGIKPKIGKLKKSIQQGSNYYSEINIDFYNNHGIFDVVEFFIFRDGKQTASLSEIDTWLVENFTDIIKKKEK